MYSTFLILFLLYSAEEPTLVTIDCGGYLSLRGPKFTPSALPLGQRHFLWCLLSGFKANKTIIKSHFVEIQWANQTMCPRNERWTIGAWQRTRRCYDWFMIDPCLFSILWIQKVYTAKYVQCTGYSSLTSTVDFWSPFQFIFFNVHWQPLSKRFPF